MPIRVELGGEPDQEHWLEEGLEIEAWVINALQDHRTDASVEVFLAGTEQMSHLNLRFRAVDSPTNVLAFPCAEPPPEHDGFLGDVALCMPVVEREAAEQGKSVRSHCAHIVTHGALHLVGFDHQEAVEADVMECEEVRLLQRLNIPDPYRGRHCWGAD